MAKVDVLVEVTMKMTLGEAKTIKKALAVATEDEVPGCGKLFNEIDTALYRGDTEDDGA